MKSLHHRTIMPLVDFGQRWHWFLAGAMLATMFGLGVTSSAGDSAIVDEVAHVPAAYSYLHYGDFRLNPEHPPLIKDLAGVPLQFMDLKFPDDQPAWTTEVNGQWESGWNFLYHIGNDAQAVLFWSRLPILLLTIGFGIVLYLFVLRRWGRAAALLTLLFYTFSPNIIAHGHYVTTDLGASVFMFLALVTFVRFIEKPDPRNLFLLSLALSLAQLAKFSSAMLYPILLLITIAVVAVWKRPENWITRAQLYIGGLVSASVLSIIWIWIYYIPHVVNMPVDVQQRLISGSLVTGGVTGLASSLLAMSQSVILQPIAHYLLGLGMVYSRVSGGNITYFNGEVTNQSYHWYFPQLFMMKTQVAFLILALIVLGAGLVVLYRRRWVNVGQRIADSIRNHLVFWTLGFFTVFYFAVSVVGNLNLGIRHILPIYVPLFVFVAVAVVALSRRLVRTRMRNAVVATLTVLLVWYAGAAVWIHPAHTAYFNELIGGPANADKYFSDSGIDWGQDLNRLKQYTDAHPEITHLALDYFGGGNPQYVFCKRAYDSQGRLIATAAGYDCSDSIYEFWHAEYGPYTGQYIAISETFLQNDRWYSALRGDSGYEYLRNMKPIAKVGYSIYVFKLY